MIFTVYNMSSVAIDHISVDPGKKTFDYLKVEEATTLRTFQYKSIFGPSRQRAVMIPLMIINGAKPGPTLCITAGIHACEYAGIEAVIRTFNKIDPNELKGVLLMVPVVNPASFWTMTPYVNIQDGIDISDAFEYEGSTVSYLIAKCLIEKLFLKADVIIDFHAGDLLEELYPHSGFTKVGINEIDDQSELLAKSFGLEIVSESIISSRKGKFTLNVPQIFVELGCCGRLDEKYVAMALQGISNIMKKLDMLNGKPTKILKQSIWNSKSLIYTTSKGIFYPNFKIGDTIKKGVIVGEIKNLKGEIVEKITSPSDGFIFLYMYNPVKLPGDLIYKCFVSEDT